MSIQEVNRIKNHYPPGTRIELIAMNDPYDPVLSGTRGTVEHAKVGIKSYYYWQKEPAVIADGENLYSYSDGTTILANSIELGADIGVLIDGEVYVGASIETEGKHVITVFDDFGNTREYTIIVVRKAPAIQYAVGEGSTNTATFERTYLFKDEVTISIIDEIDEFAMFRVYDEDGEILAILNADEIFKVRRFSLSAM